MATKSLDQQIVINDWDTLKKLIDLLSKPSGFSSMKFDVDLDKVYKIDDEFKEVIRKRWGKEK